MTPITLAHRFGAWWLFDRRAEPGAKLLGPYDRRAEAQADKRGIERLDRFGNVPGFVTTTPK